jgi:hypothetical protein
MTSYTDDYQCSAWHRFNCKPKNQKITTNQYLSFCKASPTTGHTNGEAILTSTKLLHNNLVLTNVYEQI